MRDAKLERAVRIVSQKNRENRLPVKSDYKKWAMREHKKSVMRRQHKAELKIDRDYSKQIELAIYATIALAVLSVSHPELGNLAIILAILVFAAIVQGKFDFSQKLGSRDKGPAAPRKVVQQKDLLSPPPSPQAIEHDDEVSFIEFPYRRKA
ncbi:MAG: hypothetical protein COW00_20230 [Bdellovibrio sp. CG12_big_fil_rev_8_21_14_0_65_39_13]|nr:MAG: hypothetical protein COW78_15440 [Bdellovibrio sp. CG22_combo_CG10-13_8_21_14_all_39_27]PIQ57558.1 MAG: hypothetical protein COW00_20230 [Bdellovibrio sp. CG12_big_fil_rev_8_21_14_0_65_39_13]PIR33761.1 MAG: hypothetical protein COV37_15320 [Bdellovibrio sp. CG11_big_fil_rev_8_21_14_0_20_39_38]PJB52350.1 MAG: hypothetical protein CO099_13065 [Bdellovibrio sp. CG_4_9_14_3_um_filter_39_7]